MSAVPAAATAHIEQRAAEIFSEYLTDIRRQTDRTIAILLLLQWPAGVAIALWLSPRTWIGSASSVHAHVWAAILLGGVIAVPPALLGLLRGGRPATRHVVAVAQMLASALLIHLTGGRIETHFHVFGSLAFLAFYRDWRVLVTASAVVALDHYLRGVYWPQSVFGVFASSHWRWVEHAWWVVFEDIFLIYGCARSIRLFREVAHHRAEIELNAELTEHAVVERTEQLASANRSLRAEIEERLRVEANLVAAKELADAASRAKSQFLANMSHEVRTPINGILGMNTLLRETPLDDAQRRFASAIHESGEALLSIVTDILDYSDADTGDIRLHDRPFDLRALLAAAVQPHARAAALKGLQYRLDIDASAPVRLCGDGARLAQIVSHLTANSVKFTERGSIEVAVRGEHIGRAAGDADATAVSEYQLQLTVRDTGVGIAADKLERLFQPFSQVDSSMSRKHGGLGLGLALCDRLASLMGGAIAVQSTPGRGSVFRVTVRLRAVSEASAGAAKADTAPAPLLAQEQPLRVLVVEDNAVNRQVAALFLKRLGYACDLAVDGRAALQALDRATYDAILMDVQMPEMNGYDATRAIIARFPPAQRPQIIAATAHASDADRAACLACGMDDFLSKPLRPELLAAALRAAAARLNRSDSRRALATVS